MKHNRNRTGGQSVDMLNGPLLSKIIIFALPLAATSILQQLFNAVDTAVVGRFASSQAMAAVGSNNSSINLIIALFVGMSVGANVVIASLIGQQRTDEISDAVHTAVVVALGSGLILLAAGQLVAAPLLRMVNTPEDVIDLASLYLRIYFLGMPFIMFYNFGSAILRSKGDSSRPLYALMAGGTVNVFLNLLLVIVFHLHVIGVAAATVTSNAISAGDHLRGAEPRRGCVPGGNQKAADSPEAFVENPADRAAGRSAGRGIFPLQYGDSIGNQQLWLHGVGGVGCSAEL